MTAQEKVCPVVYRVQSNQLEILAFRHPLAGKQLVKGTIEVPEPPAEAALRELEEESGLFLISRPVFLGKIPVGAPPLQWSFYGLRSDGLPDQWDHWTSDDGGLTFSFFWQPLRLDLDESWHPAFHEAFQFVRMHLPSSLG